MQFPIKIAFKVLALAPQIYVTDGTGRSLGYVRQKLLRFVEDVTVFTDESQATPIYGIKADRVIDFSANYHFTGATGEPLGSVQRKGMRSLWKAHYIISVGGQPVFEVNEKSALVRLVDGVLEEIPVLGWLTGLFLNPVYNVTRIEGGEALRMVKQRSLLETDFKIDLIGTLDAREQECAMLALVMIVLLERSRG